MIFAGLLYFLCFRSLFFACDFLLRFCVWSGARSGRALYVGAFENVPAAGVAHLLKRDTDDTPRA